MLGVMMMTTFKAEESKNLAQLANIRGKINGLTGLNLVQPFRKFIYEGDVDKVSATSGIIHTRHLFLFNDILVYGSVKHKGSLYEYSDHIFIKYLTLKDIEFKSPSKIGFQLVRNDETKQRDYILLCRSLEDKQLWINNIQLAIEESKNFQPIVSGEDLAEEATPTISNNKIEKEPNDNSMNIMKAAMVGNIDAVSQHLRAGVDISAHDPSNGQTMLHKLSHAGHATLLHLLLESYPTDTTTLANLKDFSGATALHYAANTGQTECLKILLSYGANPAILDDDQASPLHYASRSGSLDALSQLLALPAAPSLILKKDSQGLTPAAYAAFHGNQAALATLLDLMRSSHTHQQGDPSSFVEPLHFAAMKNHVECVKIVLERLDTGELVNQKDRRGLTAAHHAALNGHARVLSLLHSKGANMQTLDSTGGTVMHAACTGGNIECLKYLLSISVNFIADSGGMSPLHRAVVAGHLCIVWELLNSGSFSEELVNLKDIRGQTALHIAAESKWGGCALLLINVGKAAVKIRDDDGFTPLHIAMKHGAKEIVSYISNTEHELTKQEGELLIRLGKQHPDCVKIICQITGLSPDIQDQSNSISELSSELSESSNLDSMSISSDEDDDESTDDEEENSGYRSEIKQRVVEIWQGVRGNQLLSNLFLETVRSLYRLPQDGDFGVTYWTYVHNFVQKVSQNPATDRGLMALRKDLNLDFLENHSRVGRGSGSSFLDLRSSGSLDDSERSSDKPLLQRTVATRRIPLGSATGARLPSFSSSPSLDLQKNASRSFIKSPSSSILPHPTSSSPPSLRPEKSEDDPKNVSRPLTKSPSSSIPPHTTTTSSSSSLHREKSEDDPKKVSRSFIKSPSFTSSPPSLRREGSITSTSSKSSSSLEKNTPHSASPSSSPSPSSPSSPFAFLSLSSSLHREGSEGRISSKSQPLSGQDSQKALRSSAPLLAKSPSSTIPPHGTSPSSSLPSSPSPTSSPLLREGSEGKVSATSRRIVAPTASFGVAIDQDKNAKSKSELTINSRTKIVIGTEKASHHPGEKSPESAKKSGSSFWETAISAPRDEIPHFTTSEKGEASGRVGMLLDMAPQTITKSGSVQLETVASVPTQQNQTTLKTGEIGYSPNPIISPESEKEKGIDIMAAIEGLISDHEVKEAREARKTLEVTKSTEISDPLRPQLIRTVSTRRATKIVVYLDKKREEQIAAVLHGHDITPKRLKQAIHDADCSVLIPGLLSALAPILPSKKEAAICADYYLPDIETMSNLSDRELAQRFVVQMTATPRVHQRVEALSCRNGFELKASMIHKALKTHFAICSQLTTNLRLRNVIETLITIASNISNDPLKEEMNVHDVMQQLHEVIPDFFEIIKPIASSNTGKDNVDISIAWAELQYGVSVCKQEIPECAVGDPLISLLTDFISEAEPELEQLQKEIDVWEAITDKIGLDINELVPLSASSGEQRSDPISNLLVVLSLIQKTIKGAEKHIAATVPKRERKKRKISKRNRPTDSPKLPYARDNLRGEKILQPELTPLRVTFNAYKDFCAKTSRVRRKTYTFLKNTNK